MALSWPQRRPARSPFGRPRLRVLKAADAPATAAQAAALAHQDEVAQGFLAAVEAWSTSIDLEALAAALERRDLPAAIAATYPFGDFSRALVTCLVPPLVRAHQAASEAEAEELLRLLAGRWPVRKMAASPMYKKLWNKAKKMGPHALAEFKAAWAASGGTITELPASAFSPPPPAGPAQPPPVGAEPPKPDLQRFSLSLRLENPEATQAAKTQIGTMIQGIDAQTLAGVREIIGRAFKEGGHPRDQAKAIAKVVGLNQKQAIALANFKAAQVARWQKAEGKQEGGPNAGQPLSPKAQARVDAAWQDYHARLLRHRAIVIARTETIRASHLGQHALWRKAADLRLIDPHRTGVKWIVTHDSRLERAICEPMDGQTVPLGQPFLTGAGFSVAHPPAHPQCRCANGLVLDAFDVVREVPPPPPPKPGSWASLPPELQGEFSFAATDAWKPLDPGAYGAYLAGKIGMADFVEALWAKAWELARADEWEKLAAIDPVLPPIVGKAPGVGPAPVFSQLDHAWITWKVSDQKPADLRALWKTLRQAGLSTDAALRFLVDEKGLTFTIDGAKRLLADKAGIEFKPSLSEVLAAVEAGKATPEDYWSALLEHMPASQALPAFVDDLWVTLLAAHEGDKLAMAKAIAATTHQRLGEIVKTPAFASWKPETQDLLRAYYRDQIDFDDLQQLMAAKHMGQPGPNVQVAKQLIAGKIDLGAALKQLTAKTVEDKADFLYHAKVIAGQLELSSETKSRWS